MTYLRISKPIPFRLTSFSTVLSSQVNLEHIVKTPWHSSLVFDSSRGTYKVDRKSEIIRSHHDDHPDDCLLTVKFKGQEYMYLWIKIAGKIQFMIYAVNQGNQGIRLLEWRKFYYCLPYTEGFAKVTFLACIPSKFCG